MGTLGRSVKLNSCLRKGELAIILAPVRGFVAGSTDRPTRLPKTSNAMPKLLENLRWQRMWTSHLGAIKGWLDFTGRNISEPWLFGEGTGHFFDQAGRHYLVVAENLRVVADTFPFFTVKPAYIEYSDRRKTAIEALGHARAAEAKGLATLEEPLGKLPTEKRLSWSNPGKRRYS